MIINNNVHIEDSAIQENLKRLTNQIYKLLPNREENLDWQRPLETIIEELMGMNVLLIHQHNILFPLICKLQGLSALTEEGHFLLFRRIIFECLSLMDELKKSCLELKI